MSGEKLVIWPSYILKFSQNKSLGLFPRVWYPILVSLCVLWSSEQQEPTCPWSSLFLWDYLNKDCSKKPVPVCILIIRPSLLDTKQYFLHVLTHNIINFSFFLQPFVLMLKFILVVISKIHNQNLRLQNILGNPFAILLIQSPLFYMYICLYVFILTYPIIQLMYIFHQEMFIQFFSPFMLCSFTWLIIGFDIEA